MSYYYCYTPASCILYGISSFILSNSVGISCTSCIDTIYKIIAYYQVELSYTCSKDIDQTDLHRSEPSSLASICDEQPH